MRSEKNHCISSNHHFKNKMDVRKVLVFIPSFGMGGTVSSLKSLLSLSDPKRILVDIFPLYSVGPNKNELPNSRILKESVWLSASIKDRGLGVKAIHFFLRLVKKLFRVVGIDLTPLYIRIGAKRMNTDSYDCVVSYSEDLTSLVSQIPAKKRIAWIHSIYSRYFRMIKERDESVFFEQYDHIVCVSEYARKDFLSVYEQFTNKTLVIYNCCDEQRIQALSKEFYPKEFVKSAKSSCLFIVSVGRLDPVKQFSKIPQIAYRIKQQLGDCFRWFIIGGPCGDGQEAHIISNEINKYNVSDVVLPIGAKSNPYPYIANADVLVHPSSSETYGIVIQEALALGIPAILNNYGSAQETVIDGINGKIVPLEKIAEQVINAITDCEFLNSMRKNIQEQNRQSSVLHLETSTLLFNLL